ncbi:hypothetical protein MHYP_G00026960 [Metynnis hypsauchen]
MAGDSDLQQHLRGMQLEDKSWSHSCKDCRGKIASAWTGSSKQISAAELTHSEQSNPQELGTGIIGGRHVVVFGATPSFISHSGCYIQGTGMGSTWSFHIC